MKKLLNKKFESSSKLIGKVFQKHKMKEDLVKEVESLREQNAHLVEALNVVKVDLENKDVQLVKLAREKEKMSVSLARTKRSNESLSQQLENERSFYFKEKEAYCQEMSEYKKLKRKSSSGNLGLEEANLRKNLEKTLQTNYNLSVKFLRMKETKNFLRKVLKRNSEDYEKVVGDLKIKIERLTRDLKEILDEKFTKPLSPSNKKYLQLVNENSSLIYENLSLQLKVDKLNSELYKLRIQQTKSETNTSWKSKKSTLDDNIIKIFERENQTSVPTVTILTERETLSERKLKLPKLTDSKLAVFQVSGVTSRNSVDDFKGRRTSSAPKIVQSSNFKGLNQNK